MSETSRGVERTKPWPVLRSAQEVACDGINPMTQRSCVRGEHKGYHRDVSGAEWKDGDEIHDPRD